MVHLGVLKVKKPETPTGCGCESVAHIDSLFLFARMFMFCVSFSTSTICLALFPLSYEMCGGHGQYAHWFAVSAIACDF